MDPIGLSTENFDAIGRWRTHDDDGLPIDASGSLPDGTTYEGVAGLRQAVLKHPEAFVRTVTQKLLTYGLGRGLEYYDAPAVRGIVRDARQHDYRFSSLIVGYRQEHPLSDEEIAMIITKKALPRRTFLKGMGVTAALPFLDAMVPALTATAGGHVGGAPRVHVHPDGGAHGEMDAPGRGKTERVVADPGLAAAVSRSADDSDESGAGQGVWPDRRRSRDVELDVPELRRRRR